MLEAAGTALPLLTLNDHSIWAIVMGAGWVVKGVMIILLIFSVICWGIILTKTRSFSKTRKEMTNGGHDFASEEPRRLHSHESDLVLYGSSDAASPCEIGGTPALGTILSSGQRRFPG